MFLKHTILLIFSLVMCLTAVSARAQTVFDDELEVMKDQQTLENYHWQLQMDRRENYGAVRADEENIARTMKDLHEAQLKLFIDRNKDQSH